MGLPDFFTTIERFYRDKSRNYQRACMRAFLDWSEVIGARYGTDQGARRWRRASIDDVLDFLSLLREKRGRQPQDPRNSDRFAGGTIQLKLTILRSTYRKLMVRGLVRYNPFADPSVPRISRRWNEKRITPVVPFDVVRKVCSAPDGGTKRGLRDQALFSVLFGCGLRRQEAVELKMCDLCRTSRGTPYLFLAKTKSQEAQEQPIPDWALKKLCEYMAVRAAEGALEQSFIFVGYRFRGLKCEIPSTSRMSPSGLYKRFKDICIGLGLDPALSPHSARKTSVNKLYSDGHKLREIQLFARHKSMTTTEIYLRQQVILDDSIGRTLKY